MKTMCAMSRGWMRVALVALGCGLMSGAGIAQEGTPGKRPTLPVKTFFLKNVASQDDARDVTSTLRNLLSPEDKIYFVSAQNAIFIEASEEQLALAAKIMTDLDRPKKTYRLTFTTDELDGEKVIGTQHFQVIVVSGGRTVTKVGSKIPVVTGSFDQAKGAAENQFTYLDIGLNVDASLDESSEGLRLRSKVERLSVAEERSSVGAGDPIIRQAQMEGTANLLPGKTLVLGSLDIPGSTRHVNLSVVAELAK